MFLHSTFGHSLLAAASTDASEASNGILGRLLIVLLPLAPLLAGLAVLLYQMHSYLVAYRRQVQRSEEVSLRVASALERIADALPNPKQERAPTDVDNS